MKMTRHEEMYLEWFNHFLTTKRFAEYHEITTEEAVQVIEQGRKDHLCKHGYLLPVGQQGPVKAHRRPCWRQ